MQEFKQHIIDEIKKSTNINTEINLEIPPSRELGDFSFPCFTLAKDLKKSPIEIALDISKKIIKNDFIERVEVKGPYLNFFINKSKLIDLTLKKILKEKDKFGSHNIGKKQKALIEHTSINPNASPHVGRARNAIIGDSISRLLKFENYKTETHYFVNDVGKQIAMLVLACKNKTPTFSQLLSSYIKINKQIEKNPRLEKEVFNLLNQLEKGNKSVKSKFKKIVDICIKGQKNILEDFGINYDYFDYESKYIWNKDQQKILSRLEKTGKVSKDEEGRLILSLEGFDLPTKNPVLVLTRSDKTSLYILRDFAYTIEKMKRAKKNIIVLGEDQKLYFQQLKTSLSLIQEDAPEVIHYSFILLESGKKMATRKGDVVLLEDLMKEALTKSKQEIKKRKHKPSDKTAKIIAYGAIKFSILKNSSDKNIIFNIDNALSFEGDTAPYIQYTYARSSSILKKVKKYKILTTNKEIIEEEFQLIKKMSEFPDIEEQTLKNYQPHIMANYCLELAQLSNEFYHKCKVIQENKELMNFRLTLIKSYQQVIKNATYLLGIDLPEAM